MKRSILLATVIAGVIASPAAAAPVDLSARPVIARYLDLAARYWAVELPGHLAPCRTVSVVLEPLGSALGNDGAHIAAAGVWAETMLGGCEIDISTEFWRVLSQPFSFPGIGGHWVSAYGCATVAHEYGHILGLDDTANGLRIMDGSSDARYDDPLCNLAAYGWRRISGPDRAWLQANGAAR